MVDDKCAICLEEYGDDNKDIKIACDNKHRFHSKCLKNWYEKRSINGEQINCPLCRMVVNNVPNNQISIYTSNNAYLGPRLFVESVIRIPSFIREIERTTFFSPRTFKIEWSTFTFSNQRTTFFSPRPFYYEQQSVRYELSSQEYLEHLRKHLLEEIKVPIKKSSDNDIVTKKYKPKNFDKKRIYGYIPKNIKYNKYTPTVSRSNRKKIFFRY